VEVCHAGRLARIPFRKGFHHDIRLPEAGGGRDSAPSSGCLAEPRRATGNARAPFRAKTTACI
jgi:hypothetical protein